MVLLKLQGSELVNHVSVERCCRGVGCRVKATGVGVGMRAVAVSK